MSETESKIKPDTALVGFDEYCEIHESLGDIEASCGDITQDIIDNVDAYSIDDNPEDGVTSVSLFDTAGNVVKTFKCGDFDTAVGFLQAYFDLDDLDIFDYPDHPDEEGSAARPNPLDVDDDGNYTV